MTGDFPIDDFLRDCGFDTPAAAQAARAALERAALTRPGKRAMAAAKHDAARSLLAGCLLRVCGDGCRDIAADAMREAVVVTRPHCEVCGGSPNRQAALRAAELLQRRGVRRIVVVGGSPGTWDGLRRAFATQIDRRAVEFRIVDGEGGASGDPDANKRWAQLILVWAATELAHTVSLRYTHDVPAGTPLLTIPRRGVTALCETIVQHLEGG